MALYRYPILVWQDFSGQFTAALVEENEAAVGPTRREALDDLHDFLRWRVGENPGYPAPDFRDPALTSFKVPVRPEYRTGERGSSEGERIFPCIDAVSITVHCVSGRQAGGLLIAALPLLGVHFYYSEADSLRELATRYVQERLQGSTPREVSRYLPPRAVWLDKLIVRTPRAARRRADDAALPTLTVVAEPIGRKSLRRQTGRAWERDAELAELAARLKQSSGNVLVVGEAGIGKSTLIAAAVALAEKDLRRKRKTEGDEEPTGGPRFWLTSGGRLIAGMRFLGEWEQRCEELVGELGSIGGTLCIENLLDLVRVGGSDPAASVAAFLQTYLQHGELRMVSEATPFELDACRRLLPGLADVFQIVTLGEFAADQALCVLRRAAEHLSRQRNVIFDAGVLEFVQQLFRRFRPYHSFPGQVVAFVALLAEQAARRGSRAGGAGSQAVAIRHGDVIALFVRQTGLPEIFLRDELPLRRSEVLEHFRRQIIGQPGACDAAADLAVTFKSGMNDPARPVSVLLFCGPTGVGKTELARALARFFFGGAQYDSSRVQRDVEEFVRIPARSEVEEFVRIPSTNDAPNDSELGGDKSDRLIRLDMSEYGGFGAAQRLVSTPAGDPSELIRRIRAQPFSVVLLDEIEKAAPEVFDVLLGLFDEGRLTDRFGRTTSFRSAIIILTSNLGSEQQGSIGFGHSKAGVFEAAVQNFFRPEFFNRLDGIVTFEPLSRGTILAVTRKELADLRRREGLSSNRIHLTWSDALVARLADEGFDPRYGARPLQRTLERRLIAPLARFLLAHSAAAGHAVRADVDDSGNIRFEVDPTPAGSSGR